MRWRDAAADVLLGGVCPGCGSAGAGVCAWCRYHLNRYVPQLVTLRGDGQSVMAAGPHTSITAGIISAYKEYGHWNLATVLAQPLAAAVRALWTPAMPSQRWWIVPMPSRDAAIRGRGSDVLARLARATARLLRREATDVEVWTGLKMRRGTVDQAGLGRAERQRNLASSMFITGTTPVGRCVVVDDVTTTGASLREAHRVLRLAGVAVIGSAVVARVPR